jgi:hypothetical protein
MGGLPLKSSDHCWSVEPAAMAKFTTSSAATSVSSTGATRLSVQSKAGSCSWCGGGPLTNAKEQPDNDAMSTHTIQRMRTRMGRSPW